ncbi:hypothetical protein [Enterobacter kobei]|uniref:hypothetical protein n=1 Tax=Enterobacter kobei TaxID=208224 RepID=UPI00138DD3EE|nr:hypothetical protein [Enterobacter kobei]
MQRKQKLGRHHDSHPQRQAVHRQKLNDNEWQLTSVSAPRDKLTLNRWHMKLAGLLEQVEVKV